MSGRSGDSPLPVPLQYRSAGVPTDSSAIIGSRTANECLRLFAGTPEGNVLNVVLGASAGAVVANVLAVAAAGARIGTSANCRLPVSAVARASIRAAASRVPAIAVFAARVAGASSSSGGAERCAEVRIPLNLPPHPAQCRARSLFGVWQSAQYLVTAVSYEEIVYWKGMNSATITNRLITRANAAKSWNPARLAKPVVRAGGEGGRASSRSSSRAA
jgi:hypothetical protein